MLDVAVDRAIRFHISLNVSNLGKSIDFYRALLGVEPAKCRADYAKFEPDEPALVLSLEPSPAKTGGALNHLGFRMADAESLIEAQRRLEAAGVHTQREEGVECCYARQTKFWVHDPDRTLWEIYVLEEDIEHRGDGQAAEKVLGEDASSAVSPPAVEEVWNHRFGEPVGTIPLADESMVEARLQGSFNVTLSLQARTQLLGEAYRILQPGGRIFLHNLVADRPLPAGPPNLPGPAAIVQAVPLEEDVLNAFQAAGFVQLQLVHFDAAPCFTKGDVQMRQLKLEAVKPAAASNAMIEVLYRGPLSQVADDSGNVFPRGRRVRIAAAAAELLQKDAKDQFVVFEASAAVGGCG